MRKARIVLIAFVASTIIWVALTFLIGFGYLVFGLIVVPMTTAIGFVALVALESLIARWPALRSSAYILGLVGGALLGAAFYFTLFYGVGYTSSLLAQYSVLGAVIGLCAVAIYLRGERNA